MRTVLLRATAVGATVLLATACGATSKTGGDPPATASGAGQPVTGLRIMVPNSPGGGYDTTARRGAKVMEDAKIASSVEVFNLSGAGGTVGLAKLVNEKGNGDLAMLMGLGVVGATYTNKAQAKLNQTTPIARLIEEPGGILVSKDSPFKSVGDLISAWKANPKSVAVGGGSNPGGPDHLLPMQLAKAAGIDPKQVNYVAYDGGGDLRAGGEAGGRLCRPSSATRSRSRLRAPASTSTRSSRARSGCWLPAARSASAPSPTS